MKALVSLILLTVSLLSFSVPDTGFVTSKFTVYGNCGMCKTRIEKALKVKGVKYAYWDQETAIATVKHNPDIVSVDALHQLCADVGHDTDKVKAKKEVYENLHSCCKYDRKN